MLTKFKQFRRMKSFSSLSHFTAFLTKQSNFDIKNCLDIKIYPKAILTYVFKECLYKLLKNIKILHKMMIDEQNMSDERTEWTNVLIGWKSMQFFLLLKVELSFISSIH